MTPGRNNGATNSRFQLPALDLNFGNITDGTDIPPPPASPILKAATPAEKPNPPPKDQQKDSSKPTNGGTKSTAANGKIAGSKRPADEELHSLAASSRPGSLRRFFSRALLNNNFTEGQLSPSGSGNVADGRPASRSGVSLLDGSVSKRGSGFFRRLRSDQQLSKRSSLAFDSASATSNAPAKARPGLPPPKIPELRNLEKDSGFGSDLFKNIK